MSFYDKFKQFFKTLFNTKHDILPQPKTVVQEQVPTVTVPLPTPPVPPPVGDTINPPPVDPVVTDSAALIPPVILPPEVAQIDSRGFCKFKAVEAERASNPDWANAVTWFACEGINETFIARSNLTQAKFLLFPGISSGINLTRFNAQHCNLAYDATPAPGGFGYQLGDAYKDAVSFIGDNYDGNHNLIYKGFRPENIQAFIDNCNADLAAARARDPKRAQPNGSIPCNK